MPLRVRRETPQPWLLLDLPLLDYSSAQALQQRLVAAKRAGKLEADLLLLLEHPPVFTLGNRGGLVHLKVAPEFLAERGIPLLTTERGGEITYHGPGQVVAYPIFDLRRAGLGVAAYVALLEETMIRAVGEFAVAARRQPQRAGVWCGEGKIGSLGLRVRGGIACHGMALNVALALTPFSWIEPCGLAGARVSSLAAEAGRAISVAEFRTCLLRQFQLLFPVDFLTVSLAELHGY